MITQQFPIEEIKDLLVKIQKIIYKDDVSTLSTIEKDLLLSYTRSFYDKILHTEIESAKSQAPVEEEMVPLPPKEEKQEKIELIEAPEIEKEPEPVIVEELKIKEEVPIEIISNGSSHRDIPIEKVEIPIPSSPKPSFDDLVNKVKEQFDHTSKQPPIQLVSPDTEDDEPMVYSSINIDELFSSNTARELSDKLSQSHIEDIGRAMGLNERIFTLNELFDGDNAVFEKALSDLNNAVSFDHAKEIIGSQLAGRYNWLAESKIKKAKDFIKLVKRRYI